MKEARGRLLSQWYDVDGQRLHARIAIGPVPAERPSVVLVHGLVVSSRYMIPTAVRLAPRHPVFAPDLPGFGKSGKPARILNVPELADALASWMDAAGLAQAAIVANSFGCQIAADLAARHPERVERLVLAGPTVDPSARTAWCQTLHWLRNVRHEPISLGLVLARDYFDAGPRRVIGTTLAMLNDRIEDNLPHVQVPALVVRGERDPIVPQRWAEEAVALLPQGRLVVIPGAAHTVNYNAPDAFVRAVEPFLSGERPQGWQRMEI